MADKIWLERRADVFNVHCGQDSYGRMIGAGHNADFEVCDNLDCKAVVAEEIRRGLLVIPADGSMPQCYESIEEREAQ